MIHDIVLQITECPYKCAEMLQKTGFLEAITLTFKPKKIGYSLFPEKPDLNKFAYEPVLTRCFDDEDKEENDELSNMSL